MQYVLFVCHLTRLAVQTWNNLTEAEATNLELYTYFVTFLKLVYTYGPKHKWLGPGTVMDHSERAGHGSQLRRWPKPLMRES